MTKDSCVFPLTTVAAVTFFVFEDIMSVLLTMDLARRISRLSLTVKIISTAVALISTAIKCILLVFRFISRSYGNQFMWYDCNWPFLFPQAVYRILSRPVAIVGLYGH